MKPSTPSPAYQALLAQKTAVERDPDDAAITAKWKAAPDANGWWLWREGSGHRTELLLLAGNGRIVADDDEFEQASGLRDEGDGTSYNYWSGTDTPQALMPGHWMFLAPEQKSRPSKARLSFMATPDDLDTLRIVFATMTDSEVPEARRLGKRCVRAMHQCRRKLGFRWEH